MKDILYCVIDIGNTNIKIGLLDRVYQLVETKKYQFFDEVLQAIHTLAPKRVMLSSVRVANPDFEQALRDIAPLQVFEAHTPLPIANQYHTPHTLGVDRLAAAVGASVLYPQQPCLIVQLGTCVVIDLITPEQGFEGGSISPGLMMRLEALHHHTARLPLVSPVEFDAIAHPARETRQAIWNGVVQGIAHEIEGAIRHYQQLCRDLVPILGGGDAKFFESKLKVPIFARPNITLSGLARILEYNAPFI